jgi:hypothetical protein
METNKQLTGLKKRQQIASANKLIFLWVIGAAVALSICGVGMQFLFRQAAFNQKIIGEKAKTQTTLTNNITNARQLKQKVDELLANTDLASVKATEGDTTLKVVLDALPTADDKAALATSLQQVILPKSGVGLTELSTIALQGDVVTQGEEPVNDGTAKPTGFTFSVTGAYGQVKTMLQDLERTIRPINVTNLTLDGGDSSLRTTVKADSYYLPERTVELGKKAIKP